MVGIQWHNVNGIYQIYPRSFKDADGDGVGDLAGIIERLDYLKGSPESLGIDAIWLSPIFTSPMRDFGYDISDYKDIDPTFGSLRNFDDLVERAHALGIAVMIDFVPNHTSSDHPWFQEALRDPTSEKRDYYIFRSGRDGTPPNNWLSVFGGSAWEPLPRSSTEYYLHSFLPEQPDLNWANPKVQEEMKNILRFWFSRGVDGIRADAVRWMGKDLELRNDDPNPHFMTDGDPYHQLRHTHSRYSTELDNYLKCMTDVAREYDNRIVIFEDHLDDLTSIHDQIRRIYSIDPGIAAPFNFRAMHTHFSARAFEAMVSSYQSDIPASGRAFYCFSNHDESRLVTRFGEQQARMLAVLQLTLPGTPVIYYGQEIGMSDSLIPVDRVRDPFELRVPGKGLGRDPQRTPMQWDSSENAGFTAGAATWLPIDASHVSINVVDELADKASHLNLYRQLLRLRADYPLLRSERYETLFVDDTFYVFRRQDDYEEFIVLLNFGDTPREYILDDNMETIVSAQNVSYETPLHTVAPLDGVVARRKRK
jgi:alpha-glucosidase